ncbi:hypothetical protein J6590_048514 [Homalodisca vitripennis]|nr:hypothetical protein J6590_048514 [Homalodisca vitripennis]
MQPCYRHPADSSGRDEVRSRLTVPHVHSRHFSSLSFGQNSLSSHPQMRPMLREISVIVVVSNTQFFNGAVCGGGLFVHRLILCVIDNISRAKECCTSETQSSDIESPPLIVVLIRGREHQQTTRPASRSQLALRDTVRRRNTLRCTTKATIILHGRQLLTDLAQRRVNDKLSLPRQIKDRLADIFKIRPSHIPVDVQQAHQGGYAKCGICPRRKNLKTTVQTMHKMFR